MSTENLNNQDVGNMMICPHCRTEVPHGAKVCRGCQAEIEYGTPNFVGFIILLLSILAGFKLHSLFENLWISIIASGMLFFVMMFISEVKLFPNRVNFKRIYKTR